MTFCAFRALLGATLLSTALLAAPPGGAAPAPPDEAAPQVGTLSGAYLAANFARRNAAMIDAAALFGQAQMLDPDSLRLLHGRFSLSLGVGDTEQAVGFARRLHAIDIGDPLVPTLLMYDAVARGDLPEALAMVDSLPHHGIAGLTRPLFQAWLFAADGNRADALAEIDALRSRPGFEGLARVHRGLLLWELGDLDAAERALDDAVEHGASLRLVIAKAALLQETGRADAALALLDDFREAPEIYPPLDEAFETIAAGTPLRRPVAGVREGLAEVAFEIGRALLAEEAYDLALDHLRMALHVRPDFPDVQLLIGDLLMELDEHGLAHQTYVALPASTPPGRQAQLRAARALEALGRGEEAVAHLDALIDDAPEDPEPWVTLGDLHRVNRAFDEAVAAYDRAVELIGFEATGWSLLYRRGMALERASDWSRAERDLLRAVELNPDHAHLLNYLGYSWIDRGQNLEDGEALIRDAVAMQPDDGYIVDSLGWVYYLTGRMEEAVQMLERAVSLRPEDPVINDHLGDAYWQVGRVREAIFQWRRALRTAEEDELIEAIETKLHEGLPGAPETAGDSGSARNAKPQGSPASVPVEMHDL